MERTYVFDHLAALTTPLGLFEHALLAEPRVEHGFCLDDVARALVVTVREPAPDAVVQGLTRTYLRFVLAAFHDDGSAHNRRNADGTWADDPSTDDNWGRALWALGTAAATSGDPVVAADALVGAQVAMRARSRWPRASAYAAIGAAELLGAGDDTAARRLLSDCRPLLGAARLDVIWPWPEPRLTYANAVIPEAMVATGAALGLPSLVRDGLGLLRWLVDEQTVDGHLSPVPVGGRLPGDARPGFDQQPIEITALAEGCARALAVTGDPAWREVLDQCRDWFLGRNDIGAVLYDAATGGGFDGLHVDGVNRNQGAESTLAALAVLQLHASTTSAEHTS